MSEQPSSKNESTFYMQLYPGAKNKFSLGRDFLYCWRQRNSEANRFTTFYTTSDLMLSLKLSPQAIYPFQKFTVRDIF